MHAASSILVLGMFVTLAPAASAQRTAATAETKYVEVNGDRIGYRTIGSGSPLLLANRMRGTLDTWDPLFLDQLAQQHTVITFDYPGVGYSTGKLPGEMRQVAAFVRAFAAKINLPRAAVLGWSWGGMMTQVLLLDSPEFVTHAILVGTVPPGPNQAPIQEVWRERALKPVNDLADEEILFFEPKSEASRKAAKASRDRIYARPNVVSKIPATMPEFLAFFRVAETYREDQSGRREQLKKSSVPMLVICGDNDTSVPAANWYPLMGAISRAHLVVLAESGHGPQHQYPELSAQYIQAFLRSEADVARSSHGEVSAAKSQSRRTQQ